MLHHDVIDEITAIPPYLLLFDDLESPLLKERAGGDARLGGDVRNPRSLDLPLGMAQQSRSHPLPLVIGMAVQEVYVPVAID